MTIPANTLTDTTAKKATCTISGGSDKKDLDIAPVIETTCSGGNTPAATTDDS